MGRALQVGQRSSTSFSKNVLLLVPGMVVPGMATQFINGIDQPDVEIVIRVGCPPSIKQMVQKEMGALAKEFSCARRTISSTLHSGARNKPLRGSWRF